MRTNVIGCLINAVCFLPALRTSIKRVITLNTIISGSEGKSVPSPPGNSNSIENGSKKKKRPNRTAGRETAKKENKIPAGIKAGKGL